MKKAYNKNVIPSLGITNKKKTQDPLPLCLFLLFSFSLLSFNQNTIDLIIRFLTNWVFVLSHLFHSFYLFQKKEVQDLKPHTPSSLYPLIRNKSTRTMVIFKFNRFNFLKEEFKWWKESISFFFSFKNR